MKKIAIAFSAALLLSGCGTTLNTVYEYDADGHLLRKTETKESLVKSLTDSTKDKTVFVYDNSFLAYISASAATAEDPTPTLKMGVGKADRGALTLHKQHKLEIAPELVKAARAGKVEFKATGISQETETEK